MKRLVITTARPLSEEQKAGIEARLSHKFGEFISEYHVDEELLGGMILFDGSTVYDGSFRGKLKRAAELLKK